MYSMNDYRAALSERDNYDMDSANWRFAQYKVQHIIGSMIERHDQRMVAEVMDDVFSMNDCGMPFDNEVVQYLIWLLQEAGYKEEAQKLRELDWE